MKKLLVTAAIILATATTAVAMTDDEILTCEGFGQTAQGVATMRLSGISENGAKELTNKMILTKFDTGEIRDFLMVVNNDMIEDAWDTDVTKMSKKDQTRFIARFASDWRNLCINLASK